MSLELNARKWWECSGDELWTMNLRQPSFVAQDDECHRRGGNQALSDKTELNNDVQQFSRKLCLLEFSSAENEVAAKCSDFSSKMLSRVQNY